MGNVYEKVVRFIKNGPIIASITLCNNLIISDVSNWGAFALIYGIILEEKKKSKYSWNNFH